MGFWGVDPYENDGGADIKNIWEDYVPTGEDRWSEEETLRFFKRVYFKGALPNISEGNSSEIIALAQLYDDNRFKMPAELKEKLSLALGLELNKEKLHEWGNQKTKRAKALKKIAKRHAIDLDLASKITENSKYREEIDSLNYWFDNIDKVNSLLKNMSIKTIDWMESIKPDFIQSLEDSTWRFGDESDEDNATELSNLRYLAVVWFALFNLKYEPEEIKKVIDDIRSKS